MTDTVNLADAQRRRALADFEAALHHLTLADEALQRALGRIPVPEQLFADDVSAGDMLRRTFGRVARRRLGAAQMYARKAKEGKR